MSGHNRWSKIKRGKAIVGAAKGRLFTKLTKELTVAARTGGGETDGNHRLRAAISTARAGNMPNDSITRAIKKGTGELDDGNALEEMLYEGYGPGGVALLIECVTDNKNRTAGDVRSTLTKLGGHLGESGSVAWMFEKRGVIHVAAGPTEEQLLEPALELGALDVHALGADGFEVVTEPNAVHDVAAGLIARQVAVSDRKVAWLAKTTVHVEAARVDRVLNLVEALEENEDVQAVHGNYEFDEVGGSAAQARALRGRELDAIAAALLGPVERCVRGAERPARVAVDRRDPCAHGDRDPDAADVDRCCADGAAGPLGDRLRLRHPYALEHRDELLAAEPHEPVGAAERAGDPPSDLAEHLVASGVAVRVVDGLEVIEIEEQHCALARLLERRFERTAVAEPRERIGRRGVAQRALATLRAAALLLEPCGERGGDEGERDEREHADRRAAAGEQGACVGARRERRGDEREPPERGRPGAAPHDEAPGDDRDGRERERARGRPAERRDDRAGRERRDEQDEPEEESPRRRRALRHGGERELPGGEGGERAAGEGGDEEPEQRAAEAGAREGERRPDDESVSFVARDRHGAPPPSEFIGSHAGLDKQPACHGTERPVHGSSDPRCSPLRRAIWEAAAARCGRGGARYGGAPSFWRRRRAGDPVATEFRRAPSLQG